MTPYLSEHLHHALFMTSKDCLVLATLQKFQILGFLGGGAGYNLFISPSSR